MRDLLLQIEAAKIGRDANRMHHARLSAIALLSIDQRGGALCVRKTAAGGM